MNKSNNNLIKDLGLTDNLNDNAKRIRREYYKLWRRDNKDKIRNYNTKYWERKAEQLKQETNIR